MVPPRTLLAALSSISVLWFFGSSIFASAMWCSTCQQDVPSLGSPSNGDARCGKCGSAFSTAAVSASIAAEPVSRAPTAPATKSENAALEKMLRLPPLPEEDWALEAELRGVQRLVTSLKSRKVMPAEPMSVHFPHDLLAKAPPELSAAIEEPEDEAEVIEPQPRSNSLAWAILSLGLAVFACGAVLLTWSVVGNRQDLWPVGLPLALIGQAGLVLGVVLQLEAVFGRTIPEAQGAVKKRRSRQRRTVAAAA